MFSYQGAQFTGMGKDLYDASEEAKILFEKANDILGFRITDIMFEGEAEELETDQSYSTSNIFTLYNFGQIIRSSFSTRNGSWSFSG